MRFCLLAFFLISCFAGFCQQKPVNWHITVKTGNNQKFSLSVTGSIDSNWYIYAPSGISDDVEGISIDWENENVKPLSGLEITDKEVNIQDSIFGTALNV